MDTPSGFSKNFSLKTGSSGNITINIDDKVAFLGCRSQLDQKMFWTLKFAEDFFSSANIIVKAGKRYIAKDGNILGYKHEGEIFITLISNEIEPFYAHLFKDADLVRQIFNK